jgi:hypothetical protein
MQRNLEMEKKWYVYALDCRTGKITTALFCPNEDVAHKAIHIAGNSLEVNGYGSSLFFDYDCRGVVSTVSIEYRPYKSKDWFSKQDDGLYKKSEFDAEDFVILDLQTKKILSDIKRLHSSEIGHDVVFMYYANLEIQKFANEVRQTETIQPFYNVPFELAEESNAAPPIFIAASGKSKPTKNSALKAYNESKPATEPPDGVIIEGHSKKALAEIENAVYRGNRRAKAHPIDDEIELDKIERLRGDGSKWKDVAREISPDIAAKNINSEANRLKQKYHRNK